MSLAGLVVQGNGTAPNGDTGLSPGPGVLASSSFTPRNGEPLLVVDGDRVLGTGIHTGVAVRALIRIDQRLAIGQGNGLDRAHIDAVFTSVAEVAVDQRGHVLFLRLRRQANEPGALYGAMGMV